MSQEERLFDRWQARTLCQMMQDFYARPENRAAFEVWQANRDARKAKRPAGAGTPTSQITIGDKTYQVEYTTTEAKIPV
mgnify:CR=1 FL=1